MLFFWVLLAMSFLLFFELNGASLVRSVRAHLRICHALNLATSAFLLLLMFAYSLYSVLTSLMLLPFAVFGLWQTLRLTHVSWPSRWATWASAGSILLMVWLGTKGLHLQVHPDLMLEHFFHFDWARLIQSVDPEAHRIVKT